MESKYADHIRWIEEHSEQVNKYKKSVTGFICEAGLVDEMMTKNPAQMCESGWWPEGWWNETLLRKHAKEVAKDMSREYIDKPPHYNRGKIEVRDFIVDQQLCFQGGNVVKYVCRAGFKESTDKISDLKKAQNYLNKYIKYCEGLRDDIFNGEEIT